MGRASASLQRRTAGRSGLGLAPCSGWSAEARCLRPEGDAGAHAEARADADAGTVACTTLGPAGDLARVTQRGIDEHGRLIVVIRAACLFGIGDSYSGAARPTHTFVISLSPDTSRVAGVGFAILLCSFSAFVEASLAPDTDSVADQSATDQTTSAPEITEADAPAEQSSSALAPAPAHLRQVEADAPQQPVEQEQTGITNNPSAAQLQTSSDVPATAAVNEKLRYVAIVSAQVTYDDNIFISHFDR